ncbi:MAG: hypothetical protein K2H24_00445 [Clostridia bacterium]|nr:hypothetical protein [Clostridia bacterium]
MGNRVETVNGNENEMQRAIAKEKRLKAIEENIAKLSNEIDKKLINEKNERDTAINVWIESVNASKTDLEKKIASNVEEKIKEQKTEIENKIEDKFSNIEGRINGISDKANKDDVKSVSTVLKCAQNEQGFKTCIAHCAILILNIVAIWLIIYRPDYSNLGDNLLPWTYILILFTLMLVNIASTVIWIKLIDDEGDNTLLEAIIEVVLLIFNMVAMWLFAFNPLREVTSIVITLAVFLMLTNLLEIVKRVIYFLAECYDDFEQMIIWGIELFFLILIFFIYVCGIRV